MRLRVVLAFVAVVALAACQRSIPSPDTVRIALAQMPLTLDPRYATDAASHRVQQLLHRGLVRLDSRLLPVPDAADRWQHPDALTWIFFLKPDLRFHDGSPLQAADVAATLRSILDARHASPLRSGFAAIAAVEALTPLSVRIRLSRPDASLLTRLTLGILPARLAAGGEHARRILGAGPCRLRSWKRQWLDLACDAPGIHRRLRFIRVKDPVTRCLKLVRGEIDFTENDLPPHLLPFLRRQPQLQIRSRASTTFSYIGLNLQDPILKDVRIRHALALALDRRRLKKALLSDLPRLAETVLPPSHWAAAKLPATPYDPGRAERLLDRAGFPRRGGGLRFRLNFRTSTDPTRLRLATAIASMWERIGVQTRIESLEWGGFYARIKSGDFQVYSLSWVGIVDPDIYRWILHSSMWPPRGANRGRYSVAQVARWLDEAMRIEDRNRRRELYVRVQRRMAADQVYIPLWYEPVVAVFGPRLSPYSPPADGNLLGLLHAPLGAIRRQSEAP